MDRVRDADAAGLGETLQSRRDVHPVAINLRALDHHVAEVDADTKLHAALGRNAFVFSLEPGLDIDGALHRIDHAGELGEHAVAGRVHEPPVMLLDERVDYLAVGRKGAESRLFIFPHEAAVAEDVGAEYGGELAFHYPPLMTAIIAAGVLTLSIGPFRGRYPGVC